MQEPDSLKFHSWFPLKGGYNRTTNNIILDDLVIESHVHILIENEKVLFQVLS